MWGRLTLGVLIGCVVAWLAAPGQSKPTTAAPVCGPASAHTVAEDAVARVYRERQTVYGCALPGGEAVKLGDTALRARPRLALIALAGAIAAYAQSYHGVDTGYTSVIARRLTDGTQLSQFPASTAPVGVEGYQDVGSIVVRSDGAVAWIATAHSLGTGRSATQVIRGHGGHKTVLDHARGQTAIDPSSLRLHGSRLTWQHGGDFATQPSAERDAP